MYQSPVRKFQPPWRRTEQERFRFKSAQTITPLQGGGSSVDGSTLPSADPHRRDGGLNFRFSEAAATTAPSPEVGK